MNGALRQRLHALYAAFAAGRTDETLEFFDDAAVMTNYTPVKIFPVLGRRQGKAAIAETMRAMHARLRAPDL